SMLAVRTAERRGAPAASGSAAPLEEPAPRRASPLGILGREARAILGAVSQTLLVEPDLARGVDVARVSIADHPKFLQRRAVTADAFEEQTAIPVHFDVAVG